MKLKFAPFCSSRDALPMISFKAKVKIFIFWPKTMDYNPWFDIWSPKKLLRKVCHTKLNKVKNLLALVSVA